VPFTSFAEGSVYAKHIAGHSSEAFVPSGRGIAEAARYIAEHRSQIERCETIAIGALYGKDGRPGSSTKNPWGHSSTHLPLAPPRRTRFHREDT
jgi:hypothetical protein